MLPEELVNTVLLKLPVKDILRYKCVCKSWYSLITSPTFIDEHLKLSNTRNPDLLVKYKDAEHKCSMYPLISFISHETLEVVVGDDNYQLLFSNTDTWNKGNPPPKKRKKVVNFKDVYFVGCCNGVLCFYHDVLNVVLWNPATRDAKLLPPPLYTKLGGVYYGTGIGFGYDAKSDDYKVIAVQQKYPYELSQDFSKFDVEVYSLKTNSWRLVLRTDRKFLLCAESVGVCSGGMFSWLDKEVITFDVSNEIIIWTPLPPDCKALFSDYSKLALREHNNGCVALTHYISGKFDTWLLGEYGVKTSWTKLNVIQSVAYSNLPTGVGIWNNYEVFIRYCEVGLILVDPPTREIMKRIIIKGGIVPEMEKPVMQVFSFKESLVPITRRSLL